MAPLAPPGYAYGSNTSIACGCSCCHTTDLFPLLSNILPTNLMRLGERRKESGNKFYAIIRLISSGGIRPMFFRNVK